MVTSEFFGLQNILQHRLLLSDREWSKRFDRDLFGCSDKFSAAFSVLRGTDRGCATVASVSSACGTSATGHRTVERKYMVVQN